MSDIKQDYHKAQVLAKQGKYEQARKLLIAYDHPKTNILLSKVNDAIHAGNETPKRKGVGCVRFLAAIMLAIIIWYLLGFLMSGAILIPV